MNKIRQFLVFDKAEYYTTDGRCKIVQTIVLKFVGGRVWSYTHSNKEITLRPTNKPRHYLAVGKDGKEYILKALS